VVQAGPHRDRACGLAVALRTDSRVGDAAGPEGARHGRSQAMVAGPSSLKAACPGADGMSGWARPGTFRTGGPFPRATER